jgi:hypothetical protein
MYSTVSSSSWSWLTSQTWHLNPLPAHPNGLRFTVFDKSGDMLATNEYFSVGGGFVVNKETQTAENLYYRDINPEHAEPSRRNQTHSAAAVSTTVPQIEAGASPESADSSTSVPSVSSATPVAEKATKSTHAPSGQPPYLFATASELHKICVEQDLTIAQVVWENELAFRSADEIREGLMNREPLSFAVAWRKAIRFLIPCRYISLIALQCGE